MIRCSIGPALLLLVGFGCGNTASEPESPADDRSTSTSGAATPAAPTEPTRHPALAPLRPPGSEPVLRSLESTPGTEQHANAALFYADTDAAGMTLFWGLTAGAIDPDHSRRAEVAGAMKRVLRERIVPSNGGANVSIRLAPGATPALQQPNGTLLAPMAHLFETLMAAALAPQATSDWSGEDVRAALDAYAQLAAQGTPIDPAAPLHPWLVQIHQAGHLDGFALLVFDVAGPEHAHAVEAARQWVATNPLRLRRATMPDDLVPITP